MALDIAKLKHTICFCIAQDQVLMLLRKYSPNQGKWNGVGGKIEPGETPAQGIYREVMEEAGIDLTKALSVDFSGIVTWSHDISSGIVGGMYAFVASYNKPHLKKAKTTREGILEYKPLKWVCYKKNKEVVKNITYFLPMMLKKKKLYEYKCVYNGETLLKIDKIKLGERNI